MRSAILLLLLSLLASPAAARTWYILPDGTGDAPDIQAAIDSIGDGDTVFVAAGTYYVNLQITGIADFTLISESGHEVTEVVPNNRTACQGGLSGP